MNQKEIFYLKNGSILSASFLKSLEIDGERYAYFELKIEGLGQVIEGLFGEVRAHKAYGMEKPKISKSVIPPHRHHIFGNIILNKEYINKFISVGKLLLSNLGAFMDIGSPAELDEGGNIIMPSSYFYNLYGLDKIQAADNEALAIERVNDYIKNININELAKCIRSEIRTTTNKVNKITYKTGINLKAVFNFPFFRDADPYLSVYTSNFESSYSSPIQIYSYNPPIVFHHYIDLNFAEFAAQNKEKEQELQLQFIENYDSKQHFDILLDWYKGLKKVVP